MKKERMQQMKKPKLQQFLRRGTSLLLAGALLFGSTPAAFATTGDDPAQPTEIISDEKPTEEITEDDLTKEEETETTEETKEETTEETTNDEIIDEETDQETTEETETNDLTAEATNLLTTTADGNTLLTEPFLQLPEANSVHVVWFTEFESAENKVLLYEDGADAEPTREITAETSQLSRIRGGKTDADKDDPTIEREIWRHEAVVDGLPTYHGEEEERVPYQVVSDGVESGTYTLQAQAQPGTDMKILLTSDIQTKNMCAANIQKVSETVGQIDAILANGDIIDVPDRAYDWFDADSSFFRVCLLYTSQMDLEACHCNGCPLRLADMEQADAFNPVSYTHLDVYKRQPLSLVNMHKQL